MVKQDMVNKVVVTGGAGFIGSHLAEELARRNFHLTIVDNLSTGKIENIESLLKLGNVKFIEGDIGDLPLLQKLFQGVTYVFHQAAIPSLSKSIENPLASHEANLTGTLNVLIAAKGSGVRKVIYASSSSVYGDTPSLPKKENLKPQPKSPYAVTKIAGEYYCQIFHRVYRLLTVCLRYFNVYGPRQNSDSQYAGVVSTFISRVCRKNPLIIFGDGELTRDFIFVKDVVEANIKAAESDATGIFNIGTGDRVSINRLAELIIELVGNKVKLVYEEPKLGDIKHSLADVSKARRFHYEPKWNLRDGLKDTIKELGFGL